MQRPAAVGAAVGQGVQAAVAPGEHDLHPRGVRAGELALADVGEILKIDRSFLASRDNDALAAAIIALGENLALDVVAEGIEHAEQASWLSDQGWS